MVRVTLRLKLARAVTAAALIFWIGGVGCIFSCERGLAREEEEQSNATVRAQSSSCPSHKTPDCCVSKKQHIQRVQSAPVLNTAETALTFDVDPSKKVESCPMAINANAIASKVRSSDVALTNNQPLHQSTYVSPQPLQQSTRTTVLDREATHLRCCVFLI